MKLKVRLHHQTVRRLRAMCGGDTPAKVMIRARCLLLLHSGMSVPEVAESLGCSEPTVKRTRKRFLEKGWEDAVYDRPRSGRPRKMEEKEEKELIALACSAPPKGAARWTIRLLVKTSGHSYYTVQRILNEDGLKPWREKNVVYPEDR